MWSYFYQGELVKFSRVRVSDAYDIYIITDLN
jgi:hypothetical protein